MDVEGVRVEVRITPLATGAGPAAPCSEMELEILAAIGPKTLTGQEIADRTRIPFGGGQTPGRRLKVGS
jgi:hypothetical protein